MDLTRTWIWIWFGLVLFGFVWVVLFSLTCESLAFAALVCLSSLPIFGMSFTLVIYSFLFVHLFAWLSPVGSRVVPCK